MGAETSLIFRRVASTSKHRYRYNIDIRDDKGTTSYVGIIATLLHAVK